jgi:hypothetical protein
MNLTNNYYIIFFNRNIKKKIKVKVNLKVQSLLGQFYNSYIKIMKTAKVESFYLVFYISKGSLIIHI